MRPKNGTPHFGRTSKARKLSQQFVINPETVSPKTAAPAKRSEEVRIKLTKLQRKCAAAAIERAKAKRLTVGSDPDLFLYLLGTARLEAMFPKPVTLPGEDEGPDA